jgi:hypothetical protein
MGTVLHFRPAKDKNETALYYQLKFAGTATIPVRRSDVALKCGCTKVTRIGGGQVSIDMPKRCSGKLAFLIATTLLIAAALQPAALEYRAGTAAVGGIKAVAVEDSSGNRAVIVQADFAVSRHVSDVIASELMKSYNLGRGAILLRGKAGGDAHPDEAVTAAAAALGRLAPARLFSTGASLAILDGQERCLAMVLSDGSLSADSAPCGGRTPVHGPIRTAFRTVDISTGLRQRGESLRIYPIQAIAFGKELGVLGLGGDAPVDEFRGKNLIVAPFSNDDAPFPDDPAVRAAVRDLLRRIGR